METNEPLKLVNELKVGDSIHKGQYTIQKKIGSGAFGQVYQVIDPEGNLFAAKVEPSAAKHPQVMHEAKVYKLLEDGQLGVPTVYGCGSTEGDNKGTASTYLVMDLMGQSLEDLFNYCGR
jgi:serine/threonine protein kinase